MSLQKAVSRHISPEEEGNGERLLKEDDIREDGESVI